VALEAEDYVYGRRRSRYWFGMCSMARRMLLSISSRGTKGWEPTLGGRSDSLWVLPYPIIVSTKPVQRATNEFGFTISWPLTLRWLSRQAAASPFRCRTNTIFQMVRPTLRIPDSDELLGPVLPVTVPVAAACTARLRGAVDGGSRQRNAPT